MTAPEQPSSDEQPDDTESQVPQANPGYSVPPPEGTPSADDA
ncbi:hypothetical protein [Mycobacterium deserti]|uniref:Uncharacterized protein n=1 Tax=Mycobacterium deserti TaxID=2978347 RepID=A0ABT2MHL4_9MYCO|nr:hypothetical protein [Mycobacterium deserti]MCT7661773.1 hypothetical protein [Mycobacterium deserti]